MREDVRPVCRRASWHGNAAQELPAQHGAPTKTPVGGEGDRGWQCKDPCKIG